jgi:hypothetical protein
LYGKYGVSITDVSKSNNKNSAGTDYANEVELTLTGKNDAAGTDYSYYCG